MTLHITTGAWRIFIIEDYDKAINDFTQAIQLKPNEAGETAAIKYGSRGDAYTCINALDKAIADYTKAIQYSPAYVSAYTGRCAAYIENGDLEKAGADLEKALQIEPDNEIAKELAGHLQEIDGQNGQKTGNSFCTNCGKKIEQDWVICPFCGTKL
ncbi:MAG: tetratricopeptide repeat protein [Treponema sp.]|jgi:tetratricopeptide (TPR) repeat protein|nr:tetratricopeptide repeat protein [Treponema sp.]